MSPPTDGITAADIRIPSHGEQLAAYLYRPPGPGPAPCVVMAHGFSGTRDDALPGYAEAFAAAGLAAVVFDYRGFGTSTGEPRQVLDIAAQQQDYRAVVAWARSAEGIDPDRIALWGTSFSGGHVLAVAAAEPRIAAVVSQCPFTDSVAAISRLPLRTIVRGSALALRDIAGARRGHPPRYLPAVGARGSFAVMTSPDALPGFRSMLGPQSRWRNEVAARIVLAVAAYRPGRSAGRLPMPVLFCVCEADGITPPGPTRRAAREAPRGELRSYPYGHFDVYHDPRAKADQVEFLSRVLAGPSRAPAHEQAGRA